MCTVLLPPGDNRIAVNKYIYIYTRGCSNTICPPEDEQGTARNMLTIIMQHIYCYRIKEMCINLVTWMVDPTRSHEMPSCSAIDLAEIRRSSKISSWIWSIISGVVTVLGRPRRGATQVEKSPRLNWATQFLTVAYDSACSPNVSLRMA